MDPKMSLCYVAKISSLTLRPLSQKYIKHVSQRGVSGKPLYIKPIPLTLSHVGDRTLRDPINKHISEILEEGASKHGNKTLITFHDRRLSLRGLLHEADELANGWKGLGLESGDCVLVHGFATAAWLVAVTSAYRAGLVVAVSNPGFNAVQLISAIESTKAKVVVFDGGARGIDFQQLFSAVHPATRTVLRYVFLDDKSHGPCTMTCREVKNLGRSTACPEHGHSLDPTDPSTIMFTSGSTGNPKAVISNCFSIVNANFVGPRCFLSSLPVVETNASTLDKSGCQRDQENVVVNVPIPLHHVFGFGTALLYPALHGVHIRIPSSVYNPRACANSMKRSTIMLATPTMCHDMISLVDDMSTIRCLVIGGSLVKESQVNTLLQKGVQQVIRGYGLTETNAALSVGVYGDEEHVQASTDGHPYEGTEVRMTNVDGNVVPIGTVGEVQCRGYQVMIGYINEPVSPFTDDGWFKTGDLGIMDPNGYIRITGRVKDVILRGGEVVTAGEVERCIASIEGVSQAAAFAVADERLGEKVVVAVVLDNTKTESQVRKLAFRMLPDRLDVIKVVQTLPLTTTGKINKPWLREMFQKDGPR